MRPSALLGYAVLAAIAFEMVVTSCAVFFGFWISAFLSMWNGDTPQMDDITLLKVSLGHQLCHLNPEVVYSQ